MGETGDLAGPALGVRALLLLSVVLTWVQGERWGPPGVWAPVPERCDEERDEHGEVVAPEPAVLITAECSGVCRPIADRMLFPFIPFTPPPNRTDRDAIKEIKRERRGKVS